MKNYLIILLWTVFITVPDNIFADDIDDSSVFRKPRPTSINLQYAGNMGLISAGFGKSFFNERLCLTLIYGYLPGSVNNVSVSTIAFKPLFNFKSIKVFDNSYVNGYVGGCILRGFTHNTFVKLADYYPNGYYQQNAVHYTFFLGAKYKLLTPKSTFFNNVSSFCELGTVDYLVWYALKTQYVDYSDLWNLSFGFNFDLKRKPKNN